MHISSLQPQLAGTALEVEFSNLDIVVQCTSLNIHNQRRLFNTSCGEASQFAGRVAGWAGCSRWAEGRAVSRASLIMPVCSPAPGYHHSLSSDWISTHIYTYLHSIYIIYTVSTVWEPGILLLTPTTTSGLSTVPSTTLEIVSL